MGMIRPVEPLQSSSHRLTLEEMLSVMRGMPRGQEEQNLKWPLLWFENFRRGVPPDAYQPDCCFRDCPGGQMIALPAEGPRSNSSAASRTS